MKKLARLATLLCTLGCLGCETDSFHADTKPCVCEEAVCPANTCSFELELHPGCAGEVDLAEVVIDGHLEAVTLTPGVRAVACTRTAPGGESVVLVRGGDWLWGPLKQKCPAQGFKVHTLIFECSAVDIPE